VSITFLDYGFCHCFAKSIGVWPFSFFPARAISFEIHEISIKSKSDQDVDCAKKRALKSIKTLFFFFGGGVNYLRNLAFHQREG